jgi:beta-glucosidase
VSRAWVNLSERQRSKLFGRTEVAERPLCRSVAWVFVLVFFASVVAGVQGQPISSSSSGKSQAGSAPLTDQKVEEKVSALLGQMTLEEKIGQLTQVGGGILPGANPQEALRKGAGSVLWLSDTAKINQLQHVAVEQSRLHIPVLFGLDVIHGYHTIFPVPLPMAASWDPSVAEQAQSIAAREAAAAGIKWTFTPMVDIARDPRWGRIVEGAGEDPVLGAAMARAQVRGLQGPYLGSPDHMVACAKHFAGYGGAEGGRDYDSVYIPEERLWNVYLPPFRAAVEAQVGTLMSAYMDLNDVPASGWCHCAPCLNVPTELIIAPCLAPTANNPARR